MMNEVNKWRHLWYVVFKDGQRSQVAPRRSCQGHHKLIDELHTGEKDAKRNKALCGKNGEYATTLVSSILGSAVLIHAQEMSLISPPSFLQLL